MVRKCAGMVGAVLLACGASPTARAPADAAPADGPPGDAGPDPGTAPTDLSRVVLENRLPGSPGWNLRIRATQHQIEGYALATSAAPGDAIPIAVSVSTGTAPITWIVYRIGYYGGAGAREVQRGGPVTATLQPPCPMDAATGLVACGWKPTFALQTGAQWVTGIYLVRLVRNDGWETWVPLVLRWTGPTPAVVLVVPTTTSQAYNDFQGESLYTDQNRATGRGRAFKVSHDRPYAMGFGAGYVVRWDQLVARWLETTGEDVGYVTDEDVDADPALLAGVRAVVLSAHDEYWTAAIRGAMDDAVARGTSLLLFGANSGYWQIRYEPATDGRPRRVVTCYKDDAPRLDPVGPQSPSLTVNFRRAPVSRPENALFGVMYQDWNSFGFGAIARAPAHWALAGTGLADGDVLPLIGGYEVDSIVDDGLSPDGLTVLAEAPMLGLHGGIATGQMVVREQGDAIVFAAGGIDFAAALDGERADPRVQRIAGNVLARALHHDPPAGVVAYTPPTAAGPFAASVTTAAGLAYSPGSADGPAGVGRLQQPIAVAILPGGGVAILDRGDRTVRKLDAAGNLSTVARLSTSSLVMGFAADTAGNVYVADAWNGTITRVDATGTSSTLLSGLRAPAGLAVLGKVLYVVETDAGAIRRIDLTTGASSALTTSLFNPSGVAVAPDGTVYAVENGNQRVVVLSAGKPSKLAGDAPGFADGPTAQAKLLPHLGLAVLADGSVVVADPGNARVRLIRGGQVSTLAGTGIPGAEDGPGGAARLALPAGIAVNGAGQIFVADPTTSTVRRIVR